MARITVEDCLDNVENRFELVLVAGKRSRQIARGATPMVDDERDKPTVIALREIAEGLVTKTILEEPSEKDMVDAALLEAAGELEEVDAEAAKAASPAPEAGSGSAEPDAAAPPATDA